MIAAGAGQSRRRPAAGRHGADVNAAEPRGGQTALMWAAAEGHSDVVAGLIEMGANVNAASRTGFTPLVFATIKNDVASIEDAARGRRQSQRHRCRRAPSRSSSPCSIGIRRRRWRCSRAAPTSTCGIAAAIRRCTWRRRSATWQLVRALLAKGVDPNVAHAEIDGRRWVRAAAAAAAAAAPPASRRR